MTQSAVPQTISVGTVSPDSRLTSTCRWPKIPSTARKLATVASMNPGWRAARYCSTSQDRGARHGRPNSSTARAPARRAAPGRRRPKAIASSSSPREALYHQRRVDRSSQPSAVDQAQGGDPFGFRQRQLQGGQPTQGVAGHGRPVQSDGIHEPGDEAGQAGWRVVAGRGAAWAVAGQVEGEDLVTAAQQRQHIGPVLGVVASTVHQHQRRSTTGGQ